MDAPTAVPETSPSRLRRLWGVVKWVLFALLLAVVSYRGWGLWHDVQTRDVRLHYGWLAAAVVLYIAAWTPAWLYWRWLLSAGGDEISSLQVARAYFCGHLGKYIPGKAGVILIRAAMIAGAGGTFVRGGLTAGYESLTTLGTGAAVAAMLSPWIFPDLPQQPGWEWLSSVPGYPYTVPAVVILACLAALPLIAKLFTRLSRKAGGSSALAAADSSLLESSVVAQGISTRLLLVGSLMVIVGWCVHGLALGCIIRGSGVANVHLADWPLWTATIAAAISGGFVAIFAPAGIGVRELIVVESLRNYVSPQQAIAVAVLLRLVSLIGELIAAGGLWPFGAKMQIDAKNQEGATP